MYKVVCLECNVHKVIILADQNHTVNRNNNKINISTYYEFAVLFYKQLPQQMCHELWTALASWRFQQVTVRMPSRQRRVTFFGTEEVGHVVCSD